MPQAHLFILPAIPKSRNYFKGFIMTDDLEIAYMVRDKVSDYCIQSVLFAKGEQFFTIERPWLDNKKNISCIPAGNYKTTFLPKSASGKYRNVYHLQDVFKRLGILTHNGNLVHHSKGCIIIGKRRGKLAGKPAVLNSRTGLHEFVELMEHEPFELRIMGEQIIWRDAA